MKRQNLFINALSKYASSKTMKYVMRDALSGASNTMTTKMVDIVKTIDTLRANLWNSTFIADEKGGLWSISSYEAPSFICQYIQLGQVFVSEGYVRKVRPLIKAEFELQEEGKVLAPSEFNYFWSKYNENQKDYSLPIRKVEKVGYLLSDLSSLLGGEDGSEVYDLGGNKISDELIYFCGDILIPSFLQGSLYQKQEIGEEEVMVAIFESASNNGGKTYDSKTTSTDIS